MTSVKWSDIPEEQLNPLLARKMIHGEGLTVARLSLKKGAAVPEHSHVNEQISMIEKGVLRFHIGGKEILVSAGGVMKIPPHVPHGVIAEEDSIAIDIFTPVREDWLRGDDAYLRK